MRSADYKTKWEHCDECNKIVRMTMKCYCDMNIRQKCYLQNLKHEHWNILHMLAIMQTKCKSSNILGRYSFEYAI